MNLLIADLNPKRCKFLKEVFEEQEFDVEIASQVDEYLLLLKQNNFALIISDYHFDNFEGSILIEELKTKGVLTKVIFYSHLIDLEDRLTAFSMGAVDFIQSPFDYRELVARVQVHARCIKHNDFGVGILTIGTLVVDTEKSVVKRGKQEIALTRKEFKLLRHLLRNKGKVISREEIALRVWNNPSAKQTNVIDVYVNFLRKKIEEPNKPRIIQTVVGKGYMISEEVLLDK